MTKKKKAFYKKWWFWIIAIIIVAGVFGSGSEEDEQAKGTTAQTDGEQGKEPNEAKEKKEPEKPKTLDEKIKGTVLEITGDKSNNDKDRIDSIRLTDDAASGLKKAQISLHGDDNLTTNLTKVGMLSNSADLFEALFAYEELGEIVLQWKLPLVDVKGNVSDENVLMIGLPKDHGINWENFNYKNFPSVGEPYMMHTVLQGE